MKKKLILIGLFFLFLFFASTVFAQPKEGIIKGRVLNKTDGEKPIAGQKVTIRRFVDQNPKEDFSAETDAQGNFEFKNLSTSSKDTYFALLEFQGADYYTNPLVFKSGQKELTADLNVYDPTENPEGIKLKLHHIVIDLPESDTLAVKEILLFENSGKKTYVGSKEISAGKKETLRFSLPKGAGELKNEQGVFSQYVVSTEDGFADTMGFIPGQRQVLYSYKIKVTGSKYDFKRKIDYETPDFSLLVVNKNLKVNASKLTSQGTTEGEGGQEYLHFAGKNLKVGETLSAEISNLPSGRGIWQWIVISILAFFIVFGFSYPLVRKRLAGAEKVAQTFRPEPPPSAGTPRKILLQEIAALDDQFETGKIPKETYEKERAQMKKKLVELTQQLKTEDYE